MKEEKYRCSKCGAFEVTYVEASANPFGKKKGSFVCQKCGQECSVDSGINVINKNTINTFPNPQVDLDVDNPFTSKMKNKLKKEVN